MCSNCPPCAWWYRKSHLPSQMIGLPAADAYDNRNFWKRCLQRLTCHTLFQHLLGFLFSIVLCLIPMSVCVWCVCVSGRPVGVDVAYVDDSGGSASPSVRRPCYIMHACCSHCSQAGAVLMLKLMLMRRQSVCINNGWETTTRLFR